MSSLYIITRAKKTTPASIGMKAWNLFLLGIHFRVPEFFVLNTQAYRLYKRHKKILPEIEKQICQALNNILKQGHVAVRSSGTAEDMTYASFAGIYTTKLHLSDQEAVINAIYQVWDSNYAMRAIEYRRKMNLASGDMAVIIQHELKPDISGVMVTQSPLDINEMLIECCSGFGDKLVSGKITPTRYHIKHGEIVKKTGCDILTKHQINQLINTGTKVEDTFGSAQDIEWAFEKEKLNILQARPLAVLGCTSKYKRTVWCNANVRETIPDPISPMCWSIFDKVFFPEIIMSVFNIPISRKKYRDFRPVELISGRLYWNMNNTIAYGKAISPILQFMEGDEILDPQMAQAFNAVDFNQVKNPIPGYTMIIFSIISVVRLFYYIGLGFCRYGWMSARVKNAHDELENKAADLKPVFDLEKGLENIKNWMEFINLKFVRRYFGGLFLSIFSLVALSKFLSIRMGKRGEAIARRAIIGIIDQTGKMALGVNKLAALARRKLSKMNMLSVKKLYKTDAQFKSNFDRFIRDFGHRGPAEFDIASMNWREDHDLVFKMLVTARADHEYAVDRKRIVNGILHDLKPFERFVFKFFLPRLETFSPMRENGKHVYLKIMARIKDQFRLIEKMLIKMKYLEKSRDIFFLYLEDIENIVAQKYDRQKIHALVSQRKKDWKKYMKSEAPDIIFESGERVMTTSKSSRVILGDGLSTGRIKACARVIKDFRDSKRLRPGEILVTHHTDPGWTPLFTIASGVIIEVGGVICHAAMVARELGVPAVVIRNATSVVKDGSLIILDADEGMVELTG